MNESTMERNKKVIIKKNEAFYDNEVFAQAEVVQHPKDENSSALILTQSFHLLSNEDGNSGEK